MTECLWELPPTWEWSVLGDLGDVLSGGTPSTKVPEYWGGDVVWFAPSDLTGYDGKHIAKGAKTITEEGLAYSSAKVIPAGSVMFSSRAPVGYVAINTTPAATNQGFKSIAPHRSVFNEYLYHYLKAARRIAEDRASGTTFKELSGSAFRALPVPVAPADEQRRIVERVETLFDEIDQGVESLRDAKRAIALYRQSLLKSAFEGRLTATWRAANPDKLNEPDALLERISAQRQACYEAALIEWEQALGQWREGGNKDRRPARPKRPRTLSATPINPGVLGWTQVPLGLLVVDPIYGTPKKCGYGTGATGVLRIPNIGSGRIDPSDLKSADFDETEAAKFSLQDGDVLTIRSNGSLSVVGKPALVEQEHTDYLFAGYLIRLRPIAQSLLPKYLVYMLMAPQVRAQIETKAKSTSGVNNISAKELQELDVRICCIEEQAETVRILDDRLDAADTLDHEIDASLARAEALRHAILNMAFCGKLAPQDPNDEPAQALLARIRADRDGGPNAKPQRRPRGRARSATRP